ncbi:MAG: hypothetical protein HQL31_05825 [Planctomycetes bacterium]|nr:hypothetical protein [Planctomycetota bacterium]
MNKSMTKTLSLLSVGTVLYLLSPTFLEARERPSSDEYWTTERERGNSEYSTFGGEGYVYAGLVSYNSFSSEGEDDYTVGFKINSTLKNVVNYVNVRIDGMLGVGGPFEGLLEANVALVKGLQAGLGISYTDRIETSLRLGLYVVDEEDVGRRGGLYLLKNQSGGIELSWPVNERWSVWGDFGMEKQSNADYTRALVGLFYSF